MFFDFLILKLLAFELKAELLLLLGTLGILSSKVSFSFSSLVHESLLELEKLILRRGIVDT